MQQKWIDEGGMYFPINGEFVLHATPGPGIFRVAQSPKPMDPRLGLVPVADKFEFGYKIYPLGQEHIFNRIKALWWNEKYVASGKNLGIIFNGIKGTGKTVAAKLLCNELKLPVIIVSDTFGGAILPFIQNLNFECVILLDEAEKTFSKDADDDKILLSLIDGVYNNSRKLYMLTTNRLTVNENLLGRPGRIRYIQEFRNLPIQAVIDYCKDNLEDKSKMKKVLSEVDLLEISTIDILKAIVEEINIFGDLTDNIQMNIPKAKYLFDTVRISGCSKEDFSEIERIIDVTNPNHRPLYEWYNSVIKLSDLPEDLLARGLKSDSFVESIYTIDESELQEEKKPSVPVKSGVVEGVVTKGVLKRGQSQIPGNRLENKLDDSAKAKKGKSKKANNEIQVIRASALFTGLISNCTWSSDYRMTSNFKELWRDLDTSLGTIVEQPNHHGLFILQDHYDKSETVYLLLRQKNNPSLYRGSLGLIL